jgi:hypothetical protein
MTHYKHIMNFVTQLYLFCCKGKAIPLTGSGGPQGCETSRLTHFLDNQFTDGGDVSFMHWLPFTPRKTLVLISDRG